MTWVQVLEERAFTVAMQQARGCYQENLLRGLEAWSGSTLRGKAKKYGGRYALSRLNLLGRITAQGVTYRFDFVGRGRRKVLVLGTEPVPTIWERLLSV
jgi:hypothetical protein